MVTANAHKAEDEEKKPLLETVLEHVRRQQEEMLVLRREKINQDEEISNLRVEIRNIVRSGIISKLVTKMDQIENRPFRSPENPQQHVMRQDLESRQSGTSRQRTTGGSPLSNILRRNQSNNESLPADVFTLMMLSKPFSAFWALGIIVFACQIALCILILFDTLPADDFLSKFPWKQDTITYIGQLISLLFIILAQGDMFSSFRTLMCLRKNTRWDIILFKKDANDDPPSHWEWIICILFPNLMKFFQGCIVFFVSFIVIRQSTSLLDVVKDFTALMVVSELDNMVFDFAAYGYLGESLQLKTVDAQDIDLDDITQREHVCFGLQKFWLLFMICGTLGSWCLFFVLQKNGMYFERSFPDCVDGSGKSYFNLASQYARDGSCYGGPLNTIQCNFEDGDCLNFNMAYPLCRGDDLLDVENEVGNAVCNPSFAIPGCDYDGGDCCSYGIQRSLSFGDGKCHGGLATTEFCGYDNGDCHDFVTTYPKCPLEELAIINGNATVILGDGICDSRVYDIAECGYENGDCI